MTSVGSTLKNFASALIGPPETFMYVRGLARITCRSAAASPASTVQRVCTISALDRLCAENVDGIGMVRSASSSSTICPTLCRVSAYFGPGLPRPTTRIGGASDGAGEGLARPNMPVIFPHVLCDDPRGTAAPHDEAPAGNESSGGCVAKHG